MVKGGKMSIKIEKVETDGISMKFFRFGNGKKTMVIIPGLSVQSVMGLASSIRRDYEVMEKDFTVFVFDRRENLPESYSVADMAEDTFKAIKALDLHDIYLFGASQGGMIAMKIAMDHPELVKRLAAGSTTSEVPDDRFELMEKWIDLAKKKEKKALYLAFGEAIFPPNLFKKYRIALGFASRMISSEELDRFVILAEGLRGFNVTDRLDEIQCPVLVLCSRDDNVLGADTAEKTAEALRDKPNFTVHLYDGYGHAAYDTAPDYKERLLDFFLSTYD